MNDTQDTHLTSTQTIKQLIATYGDVKQYCLKGAETAYSPAISSNLKRTAEQCEQTVTILERLLSFVEKPGNAIRHHSFQILEERQDE